MPLFLHQWLYKDPSIRAMVTHPQDREEIVRLAIEAFDGKLHGFYLCFGEYDGVAISEFPDNQTAMACMLSIVGQGALGTMRTTPLLSPEEARESMLLANRVISPYQPPDAVS